MPNQPKTPTRPIRVPDELWALAGQVAAAQGSDRTKAILAFLRWYVGETGAELPRPASRAQP